MLSLHPGLYPRPASLKFLPSQTTPGAGRSAVSTQGVEWAGKIKDLKTRRKGKPGPQGPWEALWGGASQTTASSPGQ